MQDLRSISIGGGGGGGGFGGGGGGGRIFGSERRLRPFPNQAMKCPRCDSLNTKFCYYNNYNLSQPRHFCKNCRRYWTKGGVLRNVPVGGGCRKTKRSKPKSSTNSINGGDKDNTTTTTTTKLTTTTSRSSSDSSSLTATTTTDAAASSSTTSAAATSAAGGGGSSGCAGIFNFGSSSSGLVISQNTTQNSIMQLNHNLDQNLTGNNGIFAESGSFTNLMNDSSNQGYFGFNLSDISPFRLHHHHQEHQSQSHQKQQQEDEVIRPSEELKMTTSSTMSLVDELKGFYDQNGLTNRITGNGELTALDWQQSNNNNNNNNSLGLFELPGTVVDQSYWSQSNQWTDNDHPLYLP